MSVSQSEVAATAVAIGKIQTVIHLIHEPIKKFVSKNQQKQYLKKKNLINKSSSFDFSTSLRFLCENWDKGYSSSIKSEKSEFIKISQRCIALRNKASHQNITLEECERELEHLRRLARLINSQVESSVDSFLGLNTAGKSVDKNWQSFKETGNMLVKDGRYTEAMIEYSRAISINPREPVLYSNRAIVELKLQKFEEAREDAEDAIQFATNMPFVERVKYYRLLSEALIGLKLFEEADAVCLEGLELDPRDEVLIIRKRDIGSMISTRETDKNPREDPQTALNRIKTEPKVFSKELENYQCLDLSQENILDLKDPIEARKRLEYSQKLSVAHEYFHGLNGKKVNFKKAFEIFKETADKEFAEALYNVGLFYSHGYGVLEIDYYQMIEYYRKAASQKPFVRFNGMILPNVGVLEAEFSIGLAYKDGSGVDIDYSKAFQYFLRPAQFGISSAQNNLGLALRGGQGVAQDLKNARFWIRKAAEQGISEAQYNYARMLDQGEGGPIDEKTAMEYYQKAAKQGVLDALICFERLSKTIGDKKAETEFKETLNSLKKNDDSNALFLLGYGHLYGKSGLTKDLNLAYEYLKKSAEKDHLHSLKLLVTLLLDDLKRSEEAFSYCVKASDMGDDESQKVLAKLYAFGHGCEKNDEKARRLAQRYNLKNGKNKLDIEHEIEVGKKMVTFEKRKKLNTEKMTIGERIIRFNESEFPNPNPTIDGLFNDIIKQLTKRINAKPCNENRPMKIKWLPEIKVMAEQGSITAKRMILGWSQSFEAIELISRNENEMAMKLLRESFVNCDKQEVFLSIEQIETALEKCDPNNPNAMFVRCFLFGNDILGAIEFTKKCIRIHPTDAGFHHYLACLYGFIDSFQDGVRAINRAIELDDSNPRWYYSKAALMSLKLDQMGTVQNAQEVIEIFEKYLELNPKDDRKVPKANYSIAYLYIGMNDKDKCKMYAYRAIESEKLQLPCFVDDNKDFPKKIAVEKFLRLFSHFCGNCGKQSPKFKCPCQAEAYCDKNCQLSHWKCHKLICRIKNKN